MKPLVRPSDDEGIQGMSKPMLSYIDGHYSALLLGSTRILIEVRRRPSAGCVIERKPAMGFIFSGF